MDLNSIHCLLLHFLHLLYQLVSYTKKTQIVHSFKEKIYVLMKDFNTYIKELKSDFSDFLL